MEWLEPAALVEPSALIAASAVVYLQEEYRSVLAVSVPVYCFTRDLLETIFQRESARSVRRQRQQ